MCGLHYYGVCGDWSDWLHHRIVCAIVWAGWRGMACAAAHHTRTPCGAEVVYRLPHGAEALEAKRYDVLGSLMNVCHGLLNAIEVSTPDLENMVAIARENGAAGAKLTGAGGGGSIVALCPGKEDAVRTALQRSGYRTLLYTKSEGEQCG